MFIKLCKNLSLLKKLEFLVKKNYFYIFKKILKIYIFLKLKGFVTEFGNLPDNEEMLKELDYVTDALE